MLSVRSRYGRANRSFGCCLKFALPCVGDPGAFRISPYPPRKLTRLMCCTSAKQVEFTHLARRGISLPHSMGYSTAG